MNTRKMILRIAFLICVQHFNANDAYNIVSDKPRLHPVILVPGDGGSQIEARLNKTSVGKLAKFNCISIFTNFLRFDHTILMHQGLVECIIM